MSASRKTKSRGRLRRERQLRKQRERVKAHGDGVYVPKEFTSGEFFKRQGGFLALVVLLIAGAWWATKGPGPDKNMATAIEGLIGPQRESRSQAWSQEYPFGYKIIALTDEEIIPTAYDTLSADFKIDWKKLSVTRIKADQLKSSEEKIRIIAPQVHYLPQNISSQSMVTTTISRKPGMKVALLKFGRFEFVVEIVEDKEGYLFCLFGLKNTGE